MTLPGLVFSNLKRKKLRTTLTVLSIGVAFVLFGFLAAIKMALVGGVELAGADRIVVRHKVSIIQTLPITYEKRMERIPGVVNAVHQSWFGGIYQEPKNFFPNFPVEPKEFLEIYPEFVLPEDQKQAWFNTRTGAVVGRTTATRFNWKPGDHIALISPIWSFGRPSNVWEFDIVGIYDGAKKGTDTTGMYFRYDYFDEGRMYGKGEVGWYTVKIDDPERAADIAKAIDAEFANSPAETKSEPEGAFIQGFASQVGNIAAIVAGILSAVFFTILLVAGNTMAQSVRERTEEIGVLKAIGFSDTLVLGIVLAESMLISAIGGLGGLGLAVAIISNGNPAPGVFPSFAIPDSDMLLGLVLVFGLGLVTGIIPALQAMRLRVAVALRRHT